MYDVAVQHCMLELLGIKMLKGITGISLPSVRVMASRMKTHKGKMNGYHAF